METLSGKRCVHCYKEARLLFLFTCFVLYTRTHLLLADLFRNSHRLWVLSLFVWPLSFNFLLLLISKETVTNVVKEARPIGQHAFPPSARLSRQSENSSCVQVSWPLDDHLQDAAPSGCSFARGRPLRMTICKRPVPSDDHLQEAGP